MHWVACGNGLISTRASHGHLLFQICFPTTKTQYLPSPLAFATQASFSSINIPLQAKAAALHNRDALRQNGSEQFEKADTGPQSDLQHSTARCAHAPVPSLRCYAFPLIGIVGQPANFIILHLPHTSPSPNKSLSLPTIASVTAIE